MSSSPGGGTGSKSAVSDCILLLFANSVQHWCRHITEDDDALDKLEQEKFDVAVVDSDFSKCNYLIPHRLQIPWIAYDVGINPNVVRVPWLPSFVPSPFLPFSDKMAFTERLKNTADLFIMFFVRKRYFPDPPHEILQKFRRYGHFSSLDELVSKSVLWFTITDGIIDYPRPMMPNMVSIAGLTVKRSTGKLSTDIKNFIDGAKKGVILVTFGSIVSTIPRDVVEKFASAFRQLDGYRVIWRLNNIDNVKLPDNIMIAQWLPQGDILAHPSVKLFVTHCGTNGQYEAVYHGVPMIGFPVFLDQFYNAKRLVHKGFGLSMNIHDFTAGQLLDNIHKILEDKSYKERVTKASEIFRSQAQSPIKRATFWIEHVCRFGGDHLRSAGNDLPLYSYLMLDVLAFFITAFLFIIYVLYVLIKFVMNMCCERTASKSSPKKNE